MDEDKRSPPPARVAGTPKRGRDSEGFHISESDRGRELHIHLHGLTPQQIAAIVTQRGGTLRRTVARAAALVAEQPLTPLRPNPGSDGEPDLVILAFVGTSNTMHLSTDLPTATLRSRNDRHPVT